MKNKGAGFIFIYKDRVLLLKKANKNIWDIPGGKKEPDENYRDAAARETLEEIGKVPEFSKVGFYVNEDKKNRYKVYYAKVNKAFKCDISDEHEDYNWFSLKKLPQNLHKKIIGALNYLNKSIKDQNKSSDWFTSF